VKHNHWAILLAILFQQAFGFFWYSPTGFEQVWRKALGGMVFPNGPGVEAFAVALIAGAMFCYLMSWFFQVLVIDDWLRGLVVGTLIGLGFLLPNLATHYVVMGFSTDLVWVDGMKEVLSSGITGVILSVWRADQSPETADPVGP
jgi:hypothetical protein